MRDEGLARQLFLGCTHHRMHAPQHCASMIGTGLIGQNGQSSCAHALAQAFTVMGRMQDGAYAPFLGQLAKLVFLASSMHQLTVSVFSSIPFVIGQARPKLHL